MLSDEIKKEENKEHIKNALDPITSYINFYFYILVILLIFITISSLYNSYQIFNLTKI